MNFQSIQKRLTAAQTILQSESIDRATFESLTQLLSGINPKMDRILTGLTKAFRNVEQMQKGEVVGLLVEAWPDITPEQKKRKKLFLFFWKWWQDLQNEVARVQKELDTQNTSGADAGAAWGKIFAVAKGPLGVITAVAAGIVLLQQSSVSITVANHGCEPLSAGTSIAINIPGLKVPKAAIVDGQSEEVVVPGLSATVDATNSSIALSMYGATYNFDGVSSRIVFDGEVLNGKVTEIRLSSRKSHTLDIYCR